MMLCSIESYYHVMLKSIYKSSLKCAKSEQLLD